MSPQPRVSSIPAGAGICGEPVDLVSPDYARPVFEQEHGENETRAAFPSTSGGRVCDDPYEANANERTTGACDSPQVSIAVSDSVSPSFEAHRYTNGKRKRTETEAGALGEKTLQPQTQQKDHRPPCFVGVSLADLETELKRFGMKPGPKEYMRRELTRMWAMGTELSNVFRAPRVEAFGTGERSPEKRATETETETGAPRSKKTKPAGKTRDQTKQTNQSTEPVESFLGRFIKSNKRLYEKVLLMETVDVDETLQALDAARGKCEDKKKVPKVARRTLLRYLEQQGVAVRGTTKANAEKRARTRVR